MMHRVHEYLSTSWVEHFLSGNFVAGAASCESCKAYAQQPSWGDIHAIEVHPYRVDERETDGNIYIYIFLSHFEPFPFHGTSLWSQKGSTHLSPGTRLAFWSRGLGQHSRTASTHTKQTQSTTLFTHVLTLSTVEIIHCEEKPNASGIEP